MNVAKALESINVTEYLDGQNDDGTINISNTITIKTDYAEIKVVIGSDGFHIEHGDKLIYEF